MVDYLREHDIETYRKMEQRIGRGDPKYNKCRISRILATRIRNLR